ncbi:unnamed protein product [Rotaria magnacalcarata]|uniref:Uncharacterized protein n=3 Tax=Rotaria magnacalcarata TaxID=392030 RepID=A0A814X477_9BILA|nr:unnamed protein product [Rotaria magnacalcarata]CAF1210754.1 unnamed protein product [Rotaria magnacalcarata]CAF2078607.1 unnamed protein product [Rotaria magnacalcarata]CAF3806830.1 unnamed protein product [Rotaria magnacalcarata]CAF3840536.1 unnamed protein product [Rotaria magnacalcarata]
MDDENTGTIDQWFDSTFMILNESYQLDLRRVLSPDTCELVYALSDYYMYDNIGLFIHLLGLSSHYLTSTSFVYADNQLKHKLNLHLLIVVRAGYERSSLVEHLKQAMNNVQSLRQTGQQYDIRHTFNPNVFCRSDESTISSGLCLSDRFDEHGTYTHIQKQNSFSIIGTSTEQYLRKLLEAKFNSNSNNNSSNNNVHNHINNTDWLIMFIASKARLFCRRSKLFDPNRYPSLEQWIIVLNCHCLNLMDFYFDEPQANQFMCDYLDTLSVKATSLEDSHPWMSARYLAAREHVLRVSASLRIIESTVETLIVYRRTFHTFGQVDKVFFDNCTHIIEQTRGTTATTRVNINVGIVQSAIYFVNASIKQFEIIFEPTLNGGTPNPETSSLINQGSISDRSWITHSSSSFLPRSTSSSSKRLKTFVDPSYVKSLELAHELLLLPYVAFTRTSVYANSKLKRNAAYLDSVIEELKKHRLLIMVRQGVQMVDGTRRRVDLLVKCAPMFKEDENNNNNNDDDDDNDKNADDLIERLGRFGVEYDRYIQTLGTLDIGEKYRLSEQCFELLNSPDYKRYLTIDIERIAPLHRLQQQQQQQEHHRHSIQQEEASDLWTSSSSSSNIKLEPAEFYA